MYGVTEHQPPFDDALRLGQGPLAQVEMTDGGTRLGKAIGVLDRLRQPEGLLAMRQSFGKCAQLREAHGQAGTGVDGLDERAPKALPEQGAVQDRDILTERLRPPPIVVQGIQVEFAQAGIGDDL